ncbi:DUF1549 domain-containing protein [Rubinisphaera sp.]|uniref:DUF1549 domain-containing protein n=1 Tax=Rubinisphaera sp. TaxID=2024857 RepID=UPI0025F2852A|nr:DUF1549 domain-containing protein [Rubinisphaera sp.]
MRYIHFLFFICLIVTALENAKAEDLKPLDFSHEIVPILKKHCVECHGKSNVKGGFSINTRALFLESEAAIPGKPESSYFLDLINSPDPELQMPPFEKDRVSPAEIALLTRWVKEGMPWEAGFTFAESTYEPPLLPRKPELPVAQAGRTHPIDRILDHYLSEHSVAIPAPISDEAFLRRASLDLTGLLPTPELRDQFLQDQSPDKREQLIHNLLDNPIAYADHWLTFWNDLLRNDYTGTGFITGGRSQISGWLYAALLNNKPYDEFVRELIAPPSGESRGFIDGIKWRGEVSAGQTVEIQFSQSISQSLMGINMKCASCHDSFIDRWKLSEAYGLAAIYSERPLEIHRCDKPTGEQAQAHWIFPELGDIDASAPRDERLQQLANLMTHPDNGRLTRTIANRLWNQLMGHGIVHPVDAMHTEPWNADLLDYLASYLAEHDYDLKQLLAHIATSQAYQSQMKSVQQESDSDYVYRGPRPRRLTAEQFLDAVWQLTDSAPNNIDAPIIRNLADEEETRQLNLTAEWIWGDSAAEGKIPPAGESIMLRKSFTLDELPERAVGVLSCDNAAIVYVNGKEVAHNKDWQQPTTVILRPHLKVGGNQIVIRATNEGSTPNAAGFFFEARLLHPSGETTTLTSDSTWEWNPTLNEPREGRLGRIAGTWQPVTNVPALSVWTKSTAQPIRESLALGLSDQQPAMVRAALMKNDFLMTALGRPNRDQIVTSRPQELTTLEAINLANGETLMKSLAAGASHLQQQFQGNPEGLIEFVYEFAYSRKPSPEEQEILLTELGVEPTLESIQDLLWIVCLSPEFLYVR